MMAEGKYSVGYSAFLGYDKGEDGKLDAICTWLFLDKRKL